MGLIESASANSVWRGMDYYKDKKVKQWEQSGADAYDGIVSGSSGQEYTVHIYTSHPRKSTCNCAFAAGRKVVCKHMIALYFTVKPKAAKDFLKEVENWEAQEAERERAHYEDLKNYVKSLSRTELEERLLNAMLELEKQRYDW